MPTDLRAEIAERKGDILALLRQRSSTKRFTPPPIKPLASGEPAPLSFAQERLWFLEQLEPQSAAYNICRASRLVGNLNTSALEASLNEIISRHQSLRTAFRLDDGRPVQVVEANQNISVEWADVRSLPENERDDEIQRRIKAEAERPFDLSAGQLLRCTLLRVSDQKHVLILLTHHSVADAWSMGILTRELWMLYEAFSNGKPSSFQRLLIQYSDYAVWQRNWLQGEVLDSQLAYWRRQLENLAILNLPTDRPRTPRQSFRGARVPITLPLALTESVNELSSRYALTPFMTLLAAFQVLLFRYTGQEGFAVGSPIANRRRPEIEGLIGFFVNTLVLRADLSRNPSFRELLSRVKDTCVAADANHDLPFEKLVQELQPKRDLSRNPLFQAMFVLQNATRPFSGIPGLRIEPFEIATTRSPFDLSLFLREREEKYIGYVEYSTDLFDHDRIERMVGHFQTLLEGIVANPDQPIATLPILTEAERHRILVEWNDTVAGYPKDKCIHELFEAQVERTPQSIALEFEGEEITYQELNRRANQLARYLIGLGIGPEKLVGICVERSIEMVVGLLAILKAGGGYVPLDRAQPAERLAFMLQDSGVSVLLTEENRLATAQRLAPSARPSNISPTIVCLDRHRQQIARHSTVNLNYQSESDRLAYMIYTSGSTGQPKGVKVSHRSVVNCLHAIRERVGFTNRDVLLAVTTISFDIAALELYLPLLFGGTMVLGSRQEATDGTELLARLRKCSATAMQATPSTWRLLLNAGWQASGDFKILCGGEPLSRELAEELLKRGALWNLYGPTETTIWSTLHRVTSEDGPVPMGRPIANTQIYIVDSHLQPVPVRVPGEIYIGGDGLAQGYFNRPELTAEKFIANPFGDQHGSRLYRTGDRARYRSDGSIEFLSRLDTQVKIRGYRIELGEIEAALNQHPAVKLSVVLAQNEAKEDRGHAGKLKSGARDVKSDRCLAAYFVPTAQKPTVSELRSFLNEKLPPYMVPSAFVMLEALPLTPNGKVDRNALPLADSVSRQTTRDFVEPRSDIEEFVAQAWREVLKIERVGIHDNFFELGGHSLLAIRVLGRIRDAFNQDFPLRDFFDAPTVAGLASQVDGTVGGSRGPKLPPIVRIPRSGVFPLSLAQRQLWILDQLLPGTLFLNMPYAYRLTGLLDVEALRKSLQEIIMRHEAFHLVFSEWKGRPVQRVGKIPRLALPITDLRHLSQEEKDKGFERLSAYDAGLPFDLEEGPLIRASLVRLADDQYVLLVTTHHIVCDDWSMQIFRRELTILYDAFSLGKPSPLPEPAIQFVDFVTWQRDLTKRGILKNQLAYWKKQLRGRYIRLQFQSPGQDRKKGSFRTSTQSVEIAPATLRELKAFASRQNCTSFMVLLAVLDLVIYAQTREIDIRVGTTTANRRAKESEDLIGNCLNAVVLRSQVSPEMTFREFLHRVREVCLGAITHQEIPFGQLARVLSKENKTSSKGAVLFQVMFIYQKRAPQSVDLPGLNIASWGDSYRRAEQSVMLTTLDLIFDLREALTTLTGSVIYKSDLIDAKAVSEMVGNFQTIMTKVLRNPDQRILNMFDQRVAEQLG